MDLTSSVEEKEQVTCILQEHDPSGQVNTFPDQLPGENVAFVDTLSLTNQLRVIGRTQRQLSVTYSLLSKGDFADWLSAVRMLYFNPQSMFILLSLI